MVGVVIKRITSFATVRIVKFGRRSNCEHATFKVLHSGCCVVRDKGTI